MVTPDYVNIQSGDWDSNSNSTPTGAPFAFAKDNPYITKDYLISTPEALGLGISATSADGFYASGALDAVILEASAMVNKICQRYFDVQTIDEQKTRFSVAPANPELVTVFLNNSPYQKINSIYIQVLKWFIQIDTSPETGYVQDFPANGFYKIVPMLSNAGAGTGSPIPSEILERQPLGVLWTNYTFGFGKRLLSYGLGTADGITNVYQASLGNRLWAPSQGVNVYFNGVLQSEYTIDYPNGKVTFNTAPTAGTIVTADFTTNESIPADVRRATLLLVIDLLGRAMHNPLGLSSESILSHSVSFGDSVIEKAKQILKPYIKNTIKLF
jgi:hypothetical protein